MSAGLTMQQRAASASVAGLISTAVTMALQVVTIPVVLTYWGSERYGIWLSVIAGFMILRSIEGGYVTYVGNQLNALYHEDREALRHTLGASAAICALLGILQVLACIGLLATVGGSTLLGIANGTEDGTRAGFALTVLIVSWALTCTYPSIVHRLLAPSGFLAIGIWWGLAIQAVQTGAVVLAALMEMSITQAAIAYAGALAIAYFASAMYIRKKLPDFYPWWRGGSISVGLRDLSRSLVLTSTSAAQQAGMHGTVLIVSSLLGAMMVPAFTTARTLANLGATLGGVFANALSPELVRYFITGQHEKLVLGFRATTLFSGLAVNLSMLAIMSCSNALYTIWTNGRILFDPQLFLYLAAAVSVWSAGRTYSNFLAVTNRVVSQFVLTLIRSSAALVFGVALIDKLGLSGLAMGILLGEAMASVLATFVLVPRLLASRCGTLPRSAQVEGFLLSLPVLALAIFGALSATLPGPLILAATLIVLSLAWGVWMRLPHEARVRATSIIWRRGSERS